MTRLRILSIVLFSVVLNTVCALPNHPSALLERNSIEQIQKQKLLSDAELSKDNSAKNLGSQELNSFKNDIDIVHQLLERVPLIDGHNDLANVIQILADGQLSSFNLTDLRETEPWRSHTASHTDIVRLRKGKVGAQFWVAYTPCTSQHKDAAQKIFEQIDIILRMIELYPDTFQLATTAQEIEEAFVAGKIASLIGVEGGHNIGSSLSLLRIFYRLGVRYLTLTHSCPTLWADNSQLDNPGEVPVHEGLSGFGEAVIQEMNRLGMLVDISHVSVATMSDVLNVTQAPVIFSHSGAFSVCNHTRNVPDHILHKLAQNDGIVMVVFFNNFVACDRSATIEDVVLHIEHIRKVVGTNHIGIGSDFNGVHRVPRGLEDVSKYPNLFVELLRRGWSEEDLEKLAGRNMLRVLRRVEQVKRELSSTEPIEELIPSEDIPHEYKQCISEYS